MSALEQQIARLSSLWRGLRDGFEDGPEIGCGMTYYDQRQQDFYDAGTHIGCAVGIITLKGWAGDFL